MSVILPTGPCPQALPRSRLSWAIPGKYKAVLYNIYKYTYYTIYTGFFRVLSYPGIECYPMGESRVKGGICNLKS